MRESAKWFPTAELRDRTGWPMRDGAICMTEPEGHGAMVDIGPDVKMK